MLKIFAIAALTTAILGSLPSACSCQISEFADFQELNVAGPSPSLPNFGLSSRSTSPRSSWPLNGEWEVSLDGGSTFYSVAVPGTIEDQLDCYFDGVTIYRTSIARQTVSTFQRLFLKFDAVATHARVFFEDKLVGEHLGGWTPFSIEVTQLARQNQSADTWSVRVEVDEVVGHNTQGFLPIVIPHFGGIWQDVRLERTSMSRINADRSLATLAAAPEKLQIRVALDGLRQIAQDSIEISIAEIGPRADREESEPRDSTVDSSEWAIRADKQYRLLGTVPINKLANFPVDQTPDEIVSSELALDFPARGIKLWSPAEPIRYEMRLRVVASNGEISDEAFIGVCNRTIAALGTKITLNGAPVVLRGVLNWGYAPPSFSPSLDERWMKREIEFAQKRGFNLMKFCLWIPPKRYLELCDEMGMLAWIEYPTWHPQLDEAHLPQLEKEYREFFVFDRNHPCVILRSLTCETGPSADIDVIRALYSECKREIPGAIVEDDSSWISWNRISDFYDDHPYGNNHTWVETLGGLKRYIDEHDEKPLVLGEAIAADTWHNPGEHSFKTPLRRAVTGDDATKSANPHAPWFDESNAAWIQRLSEQARRLEQDFDPGKIAALSRHYAMLMRKFQVETYRREVPAGGYVVSVIRDFPKAGMGLIDFSDRPKSTPQQWSFQGDRMILLQSNGDRRSFWEGSLPEMKFVLCNSGSQSVGPGKLKLRLRSTDATVSCGPFESTVPPVSFDQSATVAHQFEEKIDVQRPTRFLVEASWVCENETVANSWPIWLFPRVRLHDFRVARMSSVDAKTDWGFNWVESAETADLVLANRFDRQLLDFVSRGGRAVLVPDGSQGSFDLSNQWFLRGGPVSLCGTHETWLVRQCCESELGLEEVDFVTELQHFDLAGPVVPNVDHFLDQIRPMVILWDNHDQSEVNTHAVAFRLTIGKGSVLVTTLNHVDADNAAGNWLLHDWLNQSRGSQTDDSLALSPDLESRLRTEIQRQGISLHELKWRFSPDYDRQGAAVGWQTKEFDDSRWPTIRADRHWEGQGYRELDKWAWYRLRVTLPADWPEHACFLNLEGVDDYCDIYVDGQMIASCGNMETKETAFDLRMSADLSKLVAPGEEFTLAVAVYDWFGAGGLFKPMTLSTAPLDVAPPILK